MRNWFKNILRKIKFWFQRGKRGWSDEDVWDLDCTLSKYLAETLTYLADHTHSWPDRSYNSYEEWTADLRRVAEKFRMCHVFNDAERNPYLDRMNHILAKQTFEDGKLRRNYEGNDREIEDKFWAWELQRENERNKNMQEAFDWIKENFYDLWD